MKKAEDKVSSREYPVNYILTTKGIFKAAFAVSQNGSVVTKYLMFFGSLVLNGLCNTSAFRDVAQKNWDRIFRTYRVTYEANLTFQTFILATLPDRYTVS